MKKLNKKRIKILKYIYIFIFVLVLGIFLGFNQKAQAWTEPPSGISPPGGNVAAPINISASSQTKLGQLTLGDEDNKPGFLRLFPGSDLGVPCQDGEIAYKTDQKLYHCANLQWKEFTPGAVADYLRLNAVSNPGWTKIGAQAGDIFALKGKASVPTLNNTKGIYGISGLPGLDKSSFGVLGASGSNKSIGVYGTSLAYANAYAGYFMGSVKVESIPGDSTKVTLDSEVKLCFENVCYSDWSSDLSDELYWTKDMNNTALVPSTSHMGLGGASGEEAIFYFVSGDNKNLIIGQATSSDFSCGDLVCQYFEENNPGSPKCAVDCITCQEDCPPYFTILPDDQNVQEHSAVINWTCDENHWGQVQYGKTQSLGLTQDTPSGSFSTYSITLSDLDSGTDYFYRVKVWDAQGNIDYSSPLGTFKTLVSLCGNGICDESCAECPQDCKNKKGAAGGCFGNLYCCSTGACNECCGWDRDDQCPVGQVCCGWDCDNCCYVLGQECVGTAKCPVGKCCCSDRQCHECCRINDCGPGNVCCDKACYTGQCCHTIDCATKPGTFCCADHTCQKDCTGHGGVLD